MFAINHQGFTILAGSGMELEFFYLRFLENFHFFESKKFLSQGVCKIKILILSGMLGVLMGCHMQQTEKF